MTISIVHVGLPLDHPTIPAGDGPKILKRISDIQDRMRAAGYLYQIVYVSPERGLDDFRRQLQAEPCDGVLLGGGVTGNPELSFFLEQLIDTTHELAPRAKIMFFNHALDVREIVERWFPPQTAPPAADHEKQSSL